jgi:hypothetical protein
MGSRLGNHHSCLTVPIRRPSPRKSAPPVQAGQGQKWSEAKRPLTRLNWQKTIETRFCVNGTGSKTDPKRSWRWWGKARNRRVKSPLGLHHFRLRTSAWVKIPKAAQSKRGLHPTRGAHCCTVHAVRITVVHTQNKRYQKSMGQSRRLHSDFSKVARQVVH